MTKVIPMTRSAISCALARSTFPKKRHSTSAEDLNSSAKNLTSPSSTAESARRRSRREKVRGERTLPRR